jgi:hypothetical protein
MWAFQTIWERSRPGRGVGFKDQFAKRISSYKRKFLKRLPAYQRIAVFFFSVFFNALAVAMRSSINFCGKSLGWTPVASDARWTPAPVLKCRSERWSNWKWNIRGFSHENVNWCWIKFVTENDCVELCTAFHLRTAPASLLFFKKRFIY